MLKPAALLISLLLIFTGIKAQQSSIRGRITDSAEKRNLSQAVISLLRRSDTILVHFTRSNAEGNFSIPKMDTGRYLVLITYPKFVDYLESIDLTADLDLKNVYMTPISKILDEVVLRSGSAIRIKGDTTEFVADSFKTKEGATVEDLLKKLPGFTVNSKGEIVAQGKRVDKVLVDGEEFFGDDPTMATQNIASKAVDRVQVFDTKSEQQQLTGITTGNEGKTVNIKLKEDQKKGSFGKAYAGTDFDHFVDAKAIYNKFKGKRKFSAYASKTNINTGSLNWEEKQKLGFENDFEYDEISGNYFSFGGGDEFNDWNLRGLPDAYTAGAFFTDKWNSDKHNFNSSYRFNRLGTTDKGTTLTQTILPTGITYSNNTTNKKGLNQQHAYNGKYEWKPDSLTSFKIATVMTFRTNDISGDAASEYLNADKQFINQSFRDYNNDTRRTQTDNQFVYRQMFKKLNRLLIGTIRFGTTDDDQSGINNTRINYYQGGIFDYADTIDQEKTFIGNSKTLGTKITFSEPLSAKWFMILDYAFNKNHSNSNRNTFEKGLNGKYEVPVSDFSNNFGLDAYSHSATGNMRYNWKKIRLAFGSGISAVKLVLNDLDTRVINNYRFLKITPQAQINYTLKQQTNLSVSYRGSTRQPTLNQLQPLRDNTDPLNVYRGNPDLKVGFNHGFNINFNQYKVLTQTGIFFGSGFNLQNNAIAQFNTIDDQGKRTYFPVNVNGNFSWNLYGNWNKGGGGNKPNYSIELNSRGGRIINFVNGLKSINNYTSVLATFSIQYEQVDKYSFMLYPMIGYNWSSSSLGTSINNNYLTYGGQFNGYMMLPGKLEISTNINADLRQRINAFAQNTNLFVWNAGLTRKFGKDKAGKLSLFVNDILNDNKGFTRTINSNFITDDRYLRVSRYFLLKLEWSFTKMPGAEKK